MENKYEVIEGVVKNLQIVDAHVNFLENAKGNSQTATVVATIQAAIGAPGAVHSAQAASDSGDLVESFTMEVSGHSVQGSFWETSFTNGDVVQLVGLRHRGVFKAIAVANPNARVMWMLPHCERGTTAQKIYILKASMLTLATIFLLTSYMFTMPNMHIWLYVLSSTVLAAILLGVTVGMSWKDFMIFANEVNKVGVALEIESPKSIDLSKSTKLARKAGKPDLPMGVYYY